MPKIPIISQKEFLKAIRKFGCVEVGVVGSHHRVYNPRNGLSSTIPVHADKNLGIGLFAKILKDLHIDIAEFIGAL
jgi:predicted RNA binding protein YcfA (HicA-like mRNA interferase family)